MEYVEVERAREMPGLRLVLTRDVPGPWGEAAKAFFQVKKLPFVPVAQHAGEPNTALREWTGQVSAPVAAWNDEPPVWVMNDILFLAERLAPEPALIPDDPSERAWMFGLAHEITGRDGLGWCRRLCLFELALGDRPAPGGPAGDLQRRYAWAPGEGRRGARRVIEILGLLRDQLAAQRDRGSDFFIGERLSALDLLWAGFSNMLAPMPHELCPMSPQMRETYGHRAPEIDGALDPALIAHRDRIYREYLPLPLDF